MWKVAMIDVEPWLVFKDFDVVGREPLGLGTQNSDTQDLRSRTFVNTSPNQ